MSSPLDKKVEGKMGRWFVTLASNIGMPSIPIGPDAYDYVLLTEPINGTRTILRAVNVDSTINAAKRRQYGISFPSRLVDGEYIWVATYHRALQADRYPAFYIMKRDSTIEGITLRALANHPGRRGLPTDAGRLDSEINFHRGGVPGVDVSDWSAGCWTSPAPGFDVFRSRFKDGEWGYVTLRRGGLELIE